jgi:hypothetical protein
MLVMGDSVASGSSVERSFMEGMYSVTVDVILGVSVARESMGCTVVDAGASVTPESDVRPLETISHPAPSAEPEPALASPIVCVHQVEPLLSVQTEIVCRE